ncbi:hypothetical protein Purlil1_1695 [Purpureocillium lilacinum]|uniref:Uncharacterized protein n=1 Tax=Purpureocillium lilacinum TaxID=33203 RepID=A0ABR0CD16_PURLI|nr:hypothetical protein Purlil1_1695 [Purpureocillium lilacinum]
MEWNPTASGVRPSTRPQFPRNATPLTQRGRLPGLPLRLHVVFEGHGASPVSPNPATGNPSDSIDTGISPRALPSTVPILHKRETATSAGDNRVALGVPIVECKRRPCSKSPIHANVRASGSHDPVYIGGFYADMCVVRSDGLSAAGVSTYLPAGLDTPTMAAGVSIRGGILSKQTARG